MPQSKPIRGIQLNKSHLLARGLTFFPPFNEGSGSKVFDSSGHGYIGTLVADTHWVPGMFGYALDFDQTGDYVSTNYSHTSPTGTLSIWVFLRSVTAGDWGIGTHDGKRFYISSESGIGVGDSYSNVDILLTAYKWIHLLLTFDGSIGKLFVNAIESVPQRTSYTWAGDTNPFPIGARENAAGTLVEYLDGIIDHVLFYNRVLSAFEIALLYQKPFCMFEAWNVSRITSVVANGFVEIAGDLAALSFLTDSAALKRARGIAGGVTAQSSLSGAVKVSKKISGAITATSSLSGELSLVGEVSRSRGSGFKPIEGAERLRGLRRSAFY